MQGRLENKVCYVTGAASGIGLACAQRFTNESATVIGSDLHPNPDWNNLINGENAFFELDVRDEKAQQSVTSEIIDRFGRIDTIVTSAGVAGGGPVHSIDLENWQHVQDVNLTGTMLSIKAVLPTMMEQRSGSIVTIASIEGIEGCEGGSTYNASKGGVILLTKNLANDYGRLGIRANAICPGFIKTPMFEATVTLMGERAEKIKEQHKLGRWGEADEIAGAAFFLASDDSSFITGVALPVDGGYTAGHWYGLTTLMGLE
ncbi:MAG: SDR family oxidoreductase [Acidimicrobiales bacterium]|jgi:NAD(P)-dependent dehydrogenase (short-subunit alcohol dehydrogenase family)|nr:SDR family oxidoreductase [Acidimicrobiales bacterium]MDP6297925.1 SDR family oxidoreductase [Acidimicrobiales bacterium]HJM29067.1 SDR family oxidoreductase [Acidimicrobiales bacterium]HJM98364.1 SDR family oxidoreductase [Acidimicrobiales bacterium]